MKLAQAQQKIVDVLREKPHEEFYLRSLAKALGVDPGNLSRDVKELLRQHILTQKKVGNQLHLSLNKQSGNTSPADPDYDLLKHQLQEIESEVIKITQELVQKNMELHSMIKNLESTLKNTKKSKSR